MATMPKRNKSKDNPYTLGFDETKKTYTVKFTDNKNKIHNVEISEDVFKAFDMFELEDISQIHKYRSHIEHFDLSDEMIEQRMIKKSKSMEQKIEESILIENIKDAIDKLSATQKRRIKLYYFNDLTIQEIAKQEGTTHQAVSKSICNAIEKIKEILKN